MSNIYHKVKFTEWGINIADIEKMLVREIPIWKDNMQKATFITSKGKDKPYLHIQLGSMIRKIFVKKGHIDKIELEKKLYNLHWLSEKSKCEKKIAELKGDLDYINGKLEEYT